MNLQRARYLVAVAEHLSFTRAAAELYVAQSALSQQIRVLERELGVELFDRRGPRIGLTPAGEVAVREAKYLLAVADRGVSRIRAAALGSGGELIVAHTRSWTGGAVAAALGEFRRRFPDVTVTEQRGYSSYNLGLVEAGEIDVAVVRGQAGNERIAVQVCDCEGVVLALPAGHPLTVAGQGLGLADGPPIDPLLLRDEPVVFWERRNAPGMYDAIVAALWPAGGPRVVRREADDEMVLQAVADRVGVAPMPIGRATAFRVPGVVLREIAGCTAVLDVGLATLAVNPNPAVRALLDIASRLVTASELDTASQAAVADAAAVS